MNRRTSRGNHDGDGSQAEASRPEEEVVKNPGPGPFGHLQRRATTGGGSHPEYQAGAPQPPFTGVRRATVAGFAPVAGKRPHVVIETEEEPKVHTPLSRRLLAWAMRNRYKLLLGLFVCMCLTTVAVVVPVCSILDCPLEQQKLRPVVTQPRMMITMQDPELDPLEQIPQELREYVHRMSKPGSSLQVLAFDNEEAFNETQQFLADGAGVDLLVRDFSLSYVVPDATVDESELRQILNRAKKHWVPSLLGTDGSSADADNQAHSNSSAGSPDGGSNPAGAHGVRLEGKRKRHRRQQEVQHGARGASGAAGLLRKELGRHLLPDTVGEEQDEEHSAPGVEAMPGNFTLDAMQLARGRNESGLGNSMVVPDDPLFPQQWHLPKIMADYAWAVTTGSSHVVIAVVDTGVDLSHPDIAANLWVNPGEIPGNGIDDDNNGYIDDVHGYDFSGSCVWNNYTMETDCTRCQGDSDPRDSSTESHGTHVAGLVAAIQGNGKGGSGGAPGVKIMVLKVTDCSPYQRIFASPIALAFAYAAANGAHIVSASLGSNMYPVGFMPMSPAGREHASWIRANTAAVNVLAEKNILLVAAAGNEAIDMDELLNLGYSYSPCLIQLPNVLCVGATTDMDTLDPRSNYGTSTVHMGAPGQYILSTAQGGNYTYLSGTSMSTPLVTAAAALVASVLGASNGSYRQADTIKAILMSTGDVGPTPDALPFKSGKRLNVLSAIKEAVNARVANGDVSVYPLADPSGVALDPRASYPVRLKGFRVTYCMPGTQSPQQSQQPTTQQQPRPPIIRRFRTLSQVPGGADALPPGVGEEEEEGLAYRSIQDDIPPTNRSGAIGRILSCAGRPLVAKTVVSSRGCFRHGRLVNGPGFPLLANTSALVYFVATGLYTVKVTTDAPASAWAVWSNGVLLPSVLGEAPLLVAEPGWFRLDLVTSAPSQPFDLQLKAPDNTTFAYLSDPFVPLESVVPMALPDSAAVLNATGSTSGSPPDASIPSSQPPHSSAVDDDDAWASSIPSTTGRASLTGSPTDTSSPQGRKPGSWLGQANFGGPGRALALPGDAAFPFPGLTLTPGYTIHYTGVRGSGKGGFGVPPTASGLGSDGGLGNLVDGLSPSALTGASAGSSLGWDLPASFSNAILVRDLDFAEGGSLMRSLFATSNSTAAGSGGSAGAKPYTGAVGEARTLLRPPPGSMASGGGIRFLLSCRNCSLLVEGVLVLENWESGSLPTGLTKQSGCLMLPPTAGHLIPLSVRFASPDLTAAPLALRWAPCTDDEDLAAGVPDGPINTRPGMATAQEGAAGGQVHPQPLAPYVGTNALWAPTATASSVGYIGGVQCDVWPGVTRIPLEASDALPPPRGPAFKLRLPRCANTTNEALASSCRTPFSFTLEQLLPGLSAAFPNGSTVPAPAAGTPTPKPSEAPPALHSMRCWTYLRISPSARLQVSMQPYVNATNTTSGAAGFSAAGGTAAPSTLARLGETILWSSSAIGSNSSSAGAPWLPLQNSSLPGPSWVGLPAQPATPAGAQAAGAGAPPTYLQLFQLQWEGVPANALLQVNAWILGGSLSGGSGSAGSGPTRRSVMETRGVKVGGKHKHKVKRRRMQAKPHSLSERLPETWGQETWHGPEEAQSSLLGGGNVYGSASSSDPLTGAGLGHDVKPIWDSSGHTVLGPHWEVLRGSSDGAGKHAADLHGGDIPGLEKDTAGAGSSGGTDDAAAGSAKRKLAGEQQGVPPEARKAVWDSGGHVVGHAGQDPAELAGGSGTGGEAAGTGDSGSASQQHARALQGNASTQQVTRRGMQAAGSGIPPPPGSNGPSSAGATANASTFLVLPGGSPQGPGIPLPLDLRFMWLPIPVVGKPVPSDDPHGYRTSGSDASGAPSAQVPNERVAALLAGQHAPSAGPSSSPSSTVEPSVAGGVAWADEDSWTDVQAPGAVFAAHAAPLVSPFLGLSRKVELPGTLMACPKWAAASQVLSVLSSGPPMGLNGTVSLAANLKGAEAKIFRNGGTWGLSQGYLAALGPAAVYRLQVSDMSWQGSMLTLGNVTLKNMPPPTPLPTNATAPAPAAGSASNSTGSTPGGLLPSGRGTYRMEVWLPKGLVPAAMVVKRDARSPTYTMSFDVRVLSPTSLAGPISGNAWFRSGAATRQVLSQAQAANVTAL